MDKSRFSRLAAFFCLFVVFLLGVFTPGIWAQTDSGAAADANAAEEKQLPRQFRELVLGMSLDDLKAALLEDTMFNFRGDRDVSFLPVREESLVETSGSSFIHRAFFQLRDGALFIMAFTLNTGMMDYYTIFTDLVEKYGQPAYLDPREAVWESDEVRVAIERPLTIKYIDKKVFNDIINESGTIQARRVQERQEFLNEF
jgi:hypothetical protein